MKSKNFRKTYLYICSECGEFSHTIYDYCDKCGAKDAVHIAHKKDYK